MTDFKKLAAPFDPARVSWRVGNTSADKTRALALAYIDARDVMDRLDEVVGPGNWQDECHGDGPRTISRIGIRIDDQWVWKTDGAGDTQVESEKGAISDAFKRCAVKWGIGRYLYEIDSPWVEIEPAGRSYKIKPSEKPKLIAALNGARPQEPAQQQAPAPKSELRVEYEAEWDMIATANTLNDLTVIRKRIVTKDGLVDRVKAKSAADGRKIEEFLAHRTGELSQAPNAKAA